MQGGYGLLCTVKRPATRSDGKLDRVMRHVDDRTAVEGEYRFRLAHGPDVSDAFLQITHPRLCVCVKSSPIASECNNLLRTAYPESDVVLYQVFDRSMSAGVSMVCLE